MSHSSRPSTAGLGVLEVSFSYDKQGDIDRVAIPFERAVADIVFQRVADESLTKREFLARLVGEYQLATSTVTGSLQDRQVMLTVPGQPTYQLVPRRETSFGLKG